MCVGVPCKCSLKSFHTPIPSWKDRQVDPSGPIGPPCDQLSADFLRRPVEVAMGPGVPFWSLEFICKNLDLLKEPSKK